jgi:hypothetical protein
MKTKLIEHIYNRVQISIEHEYVMFLPYLPISCISPMYFFKASGTMIVPLLV